MDYFMHFSFSMMQVLGVIGLIFTGLFAVLVIIFEKDKKEEKRLFKQINIRVFIFGVVTFLCSVIKSMY